MLLFMLVAVMSNFLRRQHFHLLFYYVVKTYDQTKVKIEIIKFSVLNIIWIRYFDSYEFASLHNTLLFSLFSGRESVCQQMYRRFAMTWQWFRSNYLNNCNSNKICVFYCPTIFEVKSWALIYHHVKTLTLISMYFRFVYIKLFF